jgi:CBS domain containing-hemolysin-like protein
VDQSNYNILRQSGVLACGTHGSGSPLVNRRLDTRDTRWVAGGGVSVDRLKATTGIDISVYPPAISARTLSDWVSGHLGREVRGGDVVERGAVRVVVRKVRRKKVQEAQVSRFEQGPPPNMAMQQTGGV